MGSYRNPHHLADTRASVQDGEMVTIWPKGLDIVWGGDSRYWNIPTDINKPAVLRQVCWLEVTTCVNINKSDRTNKYEVGFNISFGPDEFGWGSEYPIYLMTKSGKRGKASWKKIVLEVNDAKPITRMVEKTEPSDDIIYFGLYEAWSGKWKGGLRIHYAFARPILG